MRQQGWYADPHKRFDRRFWDGESWTTRVQDRGLETVDSGARRPAVMPGSSRSREEHQGLVVAGYVTGVLLAPVGFFLGFALILKDRVGHGVAVMVLSVLIMASLSMTV